MSLVFKVLMRELDRQRVPSFPSNCNASNHAIIDVGVAVLQEVIRTDYKYLRDVNRTGTRSYALKFYFFDGVNSYCRIVQVTGDKITLHALISPHGCHPGRLLGIVSNTESGIQVLVPIILKPGPD